MATEDSIAPDGDVIFICTNSDAELTQRRFRVSSQVVSNCSPVLRAMLGPHFKEGSTLAAKSTVEIDLPDDRPFAMGILFSIMHGKNAQLECQLSTNDINKLTVAADKYDAVEVMAPMAYYWVSKMLSEAPTSDLPTLLHSAYLLQQNELFEQIGRRLILENHGPIIGPQEAMVNGYATLENQRIKIFVSLTACILISAVAHSKDGRNSMDSDYLLTCVPVCVPDCTFADQHTIMCFQKLSQAGLCPAPLAADMSVHALLGLMDRVEFDRVPEAYICSGGPFGPCIGSRIASPDQLSKWYRLQAEIIRKKIGSIGVCLICIRQGIDLSKAACSHASRGKNCTVLCTMIDHCVC